MKKVTLDIDDTVYALIEALTCGPSAPQSVEEVLLQLIDHAGQGVTRPGAWEREWLGQAFGYEWTAALEPGDPDGGDGGDCFYERPEETRFPEAAVMGRVAREEIERLKREIPLERLVEASGIALERHGVSDLVGRCPFHEDRTPSLVVTPGKNEWHCLGACGEGGDAIRWVMKARGVSFRHAVELLQTDHPALTSKLDRVVKKDSTAAVKLDPPFETAAQDREILEDVVGYYHQTLKQSPEALRYLESRGLGDAEMISHFRIGFANRTLGYRLPPKTRKAGAEMRGRLEGLGILRAETGHEHYNGSIVIPVFDLSGAVVGMYGRKITPGLREGTPRHLYLPGPHQGVWNEEALLASKAVILCEALLDALTFWGAGFRNVTASYGVNGFTDDHRKAFQKHGVKQVWIAYDRDGAGDAAAERLKEELATLGIGSHRVLFPKGMDANEYALKVKPAPQSLAVLLNRAEWWEKSNPLQDSVSLSSNSTRTEALSAPKESMAVASVSDPLQNFSTKNSKRKSTGNPNENPGNAGNENFDDKDRRVETAPVLESPSLVSGPEIPASPVTSPVTRDSDSSLAAGLSSADSPADSSAMPPPFAPPLAVPFPSALPDAPPAVIAAAADPKLLVQAGVHGEELVLWQGDRRYRVRGLAKNAGVDAMKVNVLASLQDAFHADTFDMNLDRQRAAFIARTAEELGVKEDVIRKDAGRLFLALERRQAETLASSPEPKPEALLTEDERAEALALLRDPKLVERILADFERAGLVGEETNKLVAYIAAVSRHLEAPLAVVVQSSSASGKSSLMDAVLAFVPEEARIQYSAMTGQALYYMGETDLKHKILAVSEEEGARNASYALKLLQSEGVLAIASTGKDPSTGKLVTQHYRVEGPVMLFLTTTAIDVDEELLNRCLVLSVNEDRAQTQAIHRLQREGQTLEGLLAREERKRLLRLHQNAQRLIEPLAVVIPCARELSFPDARTRNRRDQMKYLTLIRAIALLHQHQRTVKTVSSRKGPPLSYIEATWGDIAIANRLAEEVLGRSLDELQPGTRRLLLLIHDAVTNECRKQSLDQNDFRFSRKDVRAWTAWNDSSLKKHLSRLEDMEYLLVHRGGRGQSFVYELLFVPGENPAKPQLPGLIPLYDLKKSPLEEKKSPSSHPQVTGVSPGGSVSETRANTGPNGDLGTKSQKSTAPANRDVFDVAASVVAANPAKGAGAPGHSRVPEVR